MTPSERRARMHELLAQGLPAAQIATDLGVARSTVHRTRLAMGVKGREASAYLVASTRLTVREASYLERLQTAGVAPSRGGVMRRIIRLASDLFEANPSEAAFLVEADRHLSRLGGNFNQIAAALSASVRKIGRAEPTAEQIAMMHEAADNVSEVRLVLVQMLRNSQMRTADLEARLMAIEEGRGVDNV